METITKKLVNNVEKTNSSALLITLALRRNQNFPRKITVTRLAVECLSTVGAAEAKETNHFPFHPVWNCFGLGLSWKLAGAKQDSFSVCFKQINPCMNMNPAACKPFSTLLLEKLVLLNRGFSQNLSSNIFFKQIYEMYTYETFFCDA